MSKTSDGDQPSLEELRERARALSEELSSLSQRIYEMECAATGVAIGDLVMFRGAMYRVCEIMPMSFGKTWLKGNKSLKGDRFGSASHHLYFDWTPIKAENVNAE